MRQVLPGTLWIGHIGDSLDCAQLLDNGIDVVVQLAIEESPVLLPRELISVRIPLYDGPDNLGANLRLAVQAVAELIRARRKTLVCCSEGMSRSPAIVAAAMALVEGRPPGDCLSQLSEMMPVDVSPGLWRDLVRLVEGLAL